MTAERNRRRIPRPSALLAAAVIVMALSPAALAAKSATVTVKTSGQCTQSSSWALVLHAPTNAPLVIKYSVTGGTAGQKSKIFISDNGIGVFAGSRIANSAGAYVVNLKVKNLLNLDVIAAASNNHATGELCGARAVI